MKFYQYINEQEEVERVKETLEKRCAPFLKEFNFPIYRGVNNKISSSISRKVSRSNRKPRFVPDDIHEKMDKLLYKQFGWKPRSDGLFCGSYENASHFGTNVYATFPVGKYKYIWTSAAKMNEIYRRYDALTRYKSKGQEEWKIYQKMEDKLLELIKTAYKTKGLDKYLKKGKKYEVIFNVESYYLVDTKVFPETQIEEFMKEF